MSDYGMMREQIRVAAGRIAPQYVDVPAIFPSAPPAVVGSVLNATMGNWFGVPTSYSYAWKRDVATAIGSNANTYTVVAGDSTHSITCVVSATNSNGTTAAPASNAIAIP